MFFDAQVLVEQILGEESGLTGRSTTEMSLQSCNR